MRIGINCFEDVEIKTIIASIGEKGACDVTGEKMYLYMIRKVAYLKL